MNTNLLFDMGDRVEVLSGPYRGFPGYIVAQQYTSYWDGATDWLVDIRFPDFPCDPVFTCPATNVCRWDSKSPVEEFEALLRKHIG